MSTNSSLRILATTESGRGSTESPLNIPTGIVGMILGSLVLIRVGKGLVRVMLVLGWTTAGIMAWVFVLVVETGTKGGGAGWLAIGVSRGTWVIAGAGGSCPMAGRLEPIVYNWVKWVTLGIVVTIKRKKKEKTKCWAMLGDSCATPMLCLLISWSY